MSSAPTPVWAPDREPAVRKREQRWDQGVKTPQACRPHQWVALGEALGVAFPPDRAPSEEEWRDALRDRPVFILLDELALDFSLLLII